MKKVLFIVGLIIFFTNSLFAKENMNYLTDWDAEIADPNGANRGKVLNLPGHHMT